MEKELIKKFVAGEASFDERKRVIDWAMSDPEKLKMLETERKIHHMMVLHAPKPGPKLLRREAVRASFRRIAKVAARVAAVLGLGIGLAYFGYSWKLNELSQSMVVSQTQAGQRINLTLTDGTTVWLNSGSKIEYPVLFADHSRRVRVSGEAMFDVMHDAKRPFIVETFACDVEVLGTKFNVKAEQDNNFFSTALLRGKIKVMSHLCGGEQIVMEPNQVVTLEHNRLVLTPMESDDDYIWTEGYINLRGRSFADLLSEFEKVFNTRIIVRGHIEGVGRKYQWGKIRVADGLDDALEILQASYPFAFKRDASANEVIIESRTM